VHATYAHGCVMNNTSCGQPYSPVAERAMTDLAVWYAGHFATLLQELDSVAEGSGTLLDQTVVVWVTALATRPIGITTCAPCSPAVATASSTPGATSVSRGISRTRWTASRAPGRL
jgi:hypothetical protein